MALGGFSAPGWFGLLGVVAAVVAGYVWTHRRARRYLLRTANLQMLERDAPRRPGWPRHIPAVLVTMALVLLTLGLARPAADAQVPPGRAGAMLVTGASASMNSINVAPKRNSPAE